MQGFLLQIEVSEIYWTKLTSQNTARRRAQATVLKPEQDRTFAHY
jgi:hypothetical protein